MTVSSAKVILASAPANCIKPLITIHVRYPRIIHGEVMTHRVFERNARSSRAVPVKTMLKEVWFKPFVPEYWGKNKPGMQAGDELSPFKKALSKFIWLASSKVACIAAWSLLKIGLHKQIANRLLEPFSFIDVLITATEWENFFELRDHEDAEPHFRDLARLMREAIDANGYMPISTGSWHLPYVTQSEWHDFTQYKVNLITLIMVSVARCARISYAPFNGKADIDSEIGRYQLLVGSKPIHASPAGHQAQLWHSDLNGCLAEGWTQYRRMLEEESDMLP